MDTVQLRIEQPGDLGAIRALHLAAFPTAAEAKLVDRLREEAAVCLSLVACAHGELIGHALFTHAGLLLTDRSHAIGALGPVAVQPARQRTGIGAQLIRSGLARCAALGLPAVIVLGHPNYYPRFGFRRADTWDVRNELSAPLEAFMIHWLSDPLPGPALAKYHPAFSEL